MFCRLQRRCDGRWPPICKRNNGLRGWHRQSSEHHVQTLPDLSLGDVGSNLYIPRILRASITQALLGSRYHLSSHGIVAFLDSFAPTIFNGETE